jgi:hypothetical protein
MRPLVRVRRCRFLPGSAAACLHNSTVDMPARMPAPRSSIPTLELALEVENVGRIFFLLREPQEHVDEAILL